MNIFFVTSLINFVFLLNTLAQSPTTSIVKSPPKEVFYGRDYFIDDQHSYVGFRIDYFGSSSVRGRFNRFKATAFYDSTSHYVSVQLILDANSINTGVELRDRDLKKEAWLSTEKYPTITFMSSAVTTAASGFELTGELGLKGKTKTVVAKFNRPTPITKDWAGNDQVDFTGTFNIKRSEFMISGGGTWDKIMENGFLQLGDDIIIEVEIHARRPDYGRRKAMLARIDSTANVLLPMLAKGNFENEVATMKESFGRRKDNVSSFTLQTLAGILRTEKRYDDAIRLLDLKGTFYPDETDTSDLLGVCYLEKGNVALGVKYFKASLEKNPADTKAMQYLRLMGER